MEYKEWQESFNTPHRKIRRNAVRCKICGDTIESVRKRDFRSCSCGACFVDGGHDYVRVGGAPNKIEFLTEFEDEAQVAGVGEPSPEPRQVQLKGTAKTLAATIHFLNDGEVVDVIPYDDVQLAAEWLTKCRYYKTPTPGLWHRGPREEAWLLYADSTFADESREARQ